MSDHMTGLAPCPFCGLTEHLSVRSEGDLLPDMPSRPYRVVCNHIDHDRVAGPVDYGKTRAIAAWNRRALAAPATTSEAVAPDTAQLIEQMVAGTAPMSKWMANVDCATYDDFERHLESQLREKLRLKATLDEKRRGDPQSESLATFVDGGSAAYEGILGTFRVVRARLAHPSPPAGEHADLVRRLRRREEYESTEIVGHKRDTIFAEAAAAISILEGERDESINRAEVAEYKLDQAVNTVQPMIVARAETAEATIAVMQEALDMKPGWSLERNYRDGDEEGDYGWIVYEVRGGINDREWTEIGFGKTPLDALRDARKALATGDRSK